MLTISAFSVAYMTSLSVGHYFNMLNIANPTVCCSRITWQIITYIGLVFGRLIIVHMGC